VSESVALCHTPLYLDFETRNTSGCELKPAGAWRYCEDPQTEILTVAYQINGKVRTWRPGSRRVPLEWLANNPSIVFACFSDFELAVWDRIMVGRHGFPPIPIERWNDVQATSALYGLPQKLENMLPAIGSTIVKDTEGSALTIGLSKRNKKTGEYPEVTPEILARVGAYNESDIEGLAAVHAATGDLPAGERKIWELHQRINRRGVCLDLDLVRAAKVIAESSREPLIAELADLTGGLTPHQVEKTREWLRDRGFTLANMQKATVAEALDEMTLPAGAKRVLELRQITAATSLKKLDAMQACVGADGRARGLYRYHGASTGRWAGRLIQPQNLPRPTVDIDAGEIEEVVAAVKTGKAAALQRWGAPLDVLTSALRFAFTAAEGVKFGVGDFSEIETCVLLALAGQRDKCDLIASGADVYRDMAVRIYRLDRDFLTIPKSGLTVEHDEQRRIGKGTVLGCGFGMSAKTFRERHLRHLPADEAKAFAEEIVRVYRTEWAPLVPRLWYNLGDVALDALQRPGATVAARCGISYRLETKAGMPCLVCTLLNGKTIHYLNARIAPERNQRGRRYWSYWKANDRGQWNRHTPYSHQLTENAVQASARELLAAAMLRLEERGWPVVMHCHDEIVVEHAGIAAEIIREIMQERPQWAEKLDVPVRADTWVGSRYRK
jgi:DNA polymerase